MLKLIARSVSAPDVILLARQSRRPRPRVAAEAARRLVAELLGRLHGPALQHAHADQPEHGEESRARLDRGFDQGRDPRAGAGGAAAGRRRRWRRRWLADHRRRRRHRRVQHAAGPRPMRGSILMVDGMLYPTSPDNLWAVDARDGTVLWQFYWKTRGGTHTGHRGVGMWQQLPVHGDARQLSRLDRRAHRQGALARRDRRLQPAGLLVDGAGHRRQPRHRRHRQRSRHARASCSRSIRRPASGSGSSTPCR